MTTTPFKLGWIRDAPDHRDRPFKLAAPIVLPPSVQLKKIPAPLNQGNIGSCVANALATVVHYDRIIQKNVLGWSLSRLLLYYNARAEQGWQAVDTGCYIRDAIKSLARDGYSVEHRWPYVTSKFTEKPPAKVYADAIKHKALVYRRLELTLNDFRSCLAEGYPFVIGASLYSNFPWVSSTGEVPMPTEEDFTEGGHAFVVCGYDDKTQMFTWQNSWGSSWGAKGRGKFPYAYLTNPGLAADGWTVRVVN